jgi:2-phosphosulfolactate phosphatase
VIDVAFSPSDIKPAPTIVVVDVLRATSTIAQALAGGYRRVLCCETLEAARALRSPARVLAGERGCVPPPGFDLGNSPAAVRRAERDELVLTTTNGCAAIVASARRSGEVVVASLLNLDAVVELVAGIGDLLVVCAGTDGRFALEDAYLAGRLVARLRGERSDAAAAARRLAMTFRSPAEALAASADAAVLRRVGLAHDIAWCARESVLDVVPRVAAVAPGIAAVEAARRSAVPIRENLYLTAEHLLDTSMRPG